MDFQPDMFISKWHLIAVCFTAVALFAMMIGKYPRKTVIKSTISSFVLFYVLVTVPTALAINTSEQRDTYVEEGLASTYEQNLGNMNDELVVFVGGFHNDNDFKAKVFAKNFHEQADFHGKVRVGIFDDHGTVIREDIYDIALNPGETKEVAPYFGNEEFEEFRYQFSPH